MGWDRSIFHGLINMFLNHPKSLAGLKETQTTCATFPRSLVCSSYVHLVANFKVFGTLESLRLGQQNHCGDSPKGQAHLYPGLLQDNVWCGLDSPLELAEFFQDQFLALRKTMENHHLRHIQAIL